MALGRGDPVEVAWSAGATEPTGQAGDRNSGRVVVVVERLRQEQGVHPDRFTLGRVTLRIPRIPIEVLVGSKLERIHVDRHDEMVALRARQSHQAQVTVVEEPHRRDEPDALT